MLAHRLSYVADAPADDRATADERRWARRRQARRLLGRYVVPVLIAAFSSGWVLPDWIAETAIALCLVVAAVLYIRAFA
jgi:hypothetical protein